MNKEQLETIKERVAKATPGPWEWRDDCYDDFWLASNHFIVVDSFGYDDGDSTIRVSEADAEFIAHARQDVPALITEVERLRGVISEALEASEKLGCSIERELAENEQLREALKFYADVENYQEWPHWEGYETRDVLDDFGKKARQALGDGDE